MKEFIFKNKKIASIGLVVISVLCIVLMIANINNVEREAYQALYDTSKALYNQYIDTAERSESVGLISNANTCYAKADELKEKMNEHKKDLLRFNIPLVLFAIISVGSLASVVLLLKKKENINQIDEDLETTSLSSKRGTI